VVGGAVSVFLVIDSLRAVRGAPFFWVVPNDPGEAGAIRWLHDVVIDLGDGRGMFHPSKSLKDAEATAVFAAYDASVAAPISSRRLAITEALWRVAGSPAPTVAHTFKDVPTASRDAVSWAVEEGIVDGASGVKFGVNGRVDRAEIARWLQRADAFRAAHQGVLISDFETGAQGWAIASWETNGGTASAVGGALVVDPGEGGNWVSWTGGLDLSGRTELLLDVSSTTGFDTKAALQLGPDWTWCETAQAGWTSTPGIAAIDLTTLSPECRALLGQVRGINVNLSQGHHVLEAITAR
jgi:mannan endo-1,4-beta-mannosidase